MLTTVWLQTASAKSIAHQYLAARSIEPPGLTTIRIDKDY
jgi:hypothetical protein